MMGGVGLREVLKVNDGRKGSWEGKSLPHRGRGKPKQAWRKDFVLRILNKFLPQDCWFWGPVNQPWLPKCSQG